MITCSEKCVYQDDGLCSVKQAIAPSNTPTSHCPYFTQKEKRVDS